MEEKRWVPSCVTEESHEGLVVSPCGRAPGSIGRIAGAILWANYALTLLVGGGWRHQDSGAPHFAPQRVGCFMDGG